MLEGIAKAFELFGFLSWCFINCQQSTNLGEDRRNLLVHAIFFQLLELF